MSDTRPTLRDPTLPYLQLRLSSQLSLSLSLSLSPLTSYVPPLSLPPQLTATTSNSFFLSNESDPWQPLSWGKEEGLLV